MQAHLFKRHKIKDKEIGYYMWYMENPNGVLTAPYIKQVADFLKVGERRLVALITGRSWGHAENCWVERVEIIPFSLQAPASHEAGAIRIQLIQVRPLLPSFHPFLKFTSQTSLASLIIQQQLHLRPIVNFKASACSSLSSSDDSLIAPISR